MDPALCQQGRIQDLKKEGRRGSGGSPPRFLTHFGDFLENLAQKGVGVRPHLDLHLVSESAGKLSVSAQYAGKAWLEPLISQNIKQKRNEMRF